SAAVAVAVGVTVWQFLAAQPRQLTLQDVRRAFGEGAPSSLPPFAGEFDAERPPGWHRLDYVGEAAGYQPDGWDRQAAAVYEFQLRRSRREPIEGLLVVLPATHVAAPPAATSFGGAPTVYHRRYATVAWTSGGTVYVCFVKGGDDGVQALKRALRSSLA
ncbi:MAG: hypothetical protein ACREIV_14390, partial [Planctomycetaceae bacterium]